ncbi:hypothetical protein GC163_08105 [bacterium]|nr:hypothetical protein [bacterium]
MNRIFLPLSLLSTVCLIITFVLGWQIDDPRVADRVVQQGVQTHFLMALASLCFATLVHALVLTYFMGTGRWIEETSNAYRLSPELYRENQSIKYRVIPVLIGAFLLLLATGAFGAAADPASPMQFSGWLGFTPAELHQALALTALAANVRAHYFEYTALFQNGEVVERVLAEVRRIRQEKGLAV